MAATRPVVEPQDIPLPSSSRSKGKGKGKQQVRGSQKPRVGAEPDNLEDQWDWISLTDSSTTRFPPFFSHDSTYFFSLVGSSVKIHATATGQVVSTLSPPQSSTKDSNFATLTCAIISPQNPFQIITGSRDGCLRIWDYLEGSLMKTINVAQPILHVCAHEHHKNFVFVAAARPKKPGTSKEENATVLRISLNVKENSQSSTDSLTIGKTRIPTGLQFSPSGSYLVVTASHKAYIAVVSSLKSGFTKYVSPDRLTCLAFHPTEDYFATGDAKGNIRLWYCLDEEELAQAGKIVGVEKKTQTTSFHWHAHAVSSLSFTANGAYLLSGGEESVLVVWHITSGKKEFVPRLGSPINTISLSRPADAEEEYLLNLADGTFLFINSTTLKVSRTYCQLRLDPGRSQRPKTAPLAYHSSSATLILPSSHPSSLQIYSPATSALVSELEVSPTNRVSRRDEKPLEPCRVEQIVLSPSGEWMATVDVRDGDKSFRGECYLKLWKWDRKSGYWELNTRVDRPHGVDNVTHLTFSPQSNYLTSTGEDGMIRTWRIHHQSSDKSESWVSRSAMSFRAEIPKHASFSEDGSLFSVSLGPYIALYDPLSNVLCKILTNPRRTKITRAYFLGKSCRFLAATGKLDVTVWDLVSQSIVWQHTDVLEIVGTVPHTSTDSFAVFQHNNNITRISIFGATSPAPIKVHNLPVPLLSVGWYPISLRQNAAAFNFMSITTSWSVVLLGDEIRAEERSIAASKLYTAVAPRRSLFQDIFGKSIFDSPSASSSAPTYHPQLTHETSNEVFNMPCYSTPSIESLYDRLMQPLLKSRKAEKSPSVDTAMLVDEKELQDPSPAAPSHEPPSLADDTELAMLSGLFKIQQIPVYQSQVVPRINGVVNGKINGSVKHTPSKTTSNHVNHPPSSPPLPTVNGNKKRKKT